MRTPARGPPETPAASHGERHSGTPRRLPYCASKSPATWSVLPPGLRRHRTSPLVPPHPSRNFGERTFPEPPSPKRAYAHGRNREPFVHRAEPAASHVGSAPRSDGLCVAASAVPSCPSPESDLRTRLTPPVSSTAAPLSSAAWARRCQSPPAPYADVCSISWRLRKWSRRQTRILCGSARKAPPLFSTPTSSSAMGYRPTQEYSFVWGVGQIKLPKWANSEYRNHFLRPRACGRKSQVGGKSG